MCSLSLQTQIISAEEVANSTEVAQTQETSPGPASTKRKFVNYTVRYADQEGRDIVAPVKKLDFSGTNIIVKLVKHLTRRQLMKSNGLSKKFKKPVF
ncbi:hypothetical protein [Streptococcus sp. 20-1249]|uniref:hypothetical protein n=1 Tax=Streptococcus hepaticus TaxID=3349163 RepID=UPI003749976E